MASLHPGITRKLCYNILEYSHILSSSSSCKMLALLRSSFRYFQSFNKNCRPQRTLKFYDNFNIKSQLQFSRKLSDKIDWVGQQKIQVKLRKIFDKRPVAVVELNSFLEKDIKAMSSRDILTLFDKLHEHKITLNNDHLSLIMQIFLNNPEKLSGEDIYQIVRFSKVIRHPALKNEMWSLILSKVTNLVLLFSRYQ